MPSGQLCSDNRDEAAEGRRSNFLDIFRSRNLRIKSVILYYGWFVNAFAYYGLVMNTENLGGDVFLNFLISGLLEIPAYTVAMWVILKKGRRAPYVSSMLLCGVSLLCIMFVPRGAYPGDWPAVAIALFGKLCITFSFGVLYLYTAEIYPTELRISGIGSCSFVGRIGGMVAPWLGELGARHHPYIPVVVFGVSAIVAGGMAVLLPETHNLKMPDTIREAEDMKLGACFWARKKEESSKETETGGEGS